MIIPELPDYLTSLGGAEYKGFIIGLFTLTAGLARPLSGKLTDTVGRVPVQIIGTLVCVVASLFYPFVTTVFAFLLLRLLHGFSTGFKPTATVAYAADIVPPHRVGEAMGILGVSMNTGASIAPPVGSWIAAAWNMDVMFYTSSALALVSVLILLRLPETLENRHQFKPSLLKIAPRDIFEKTALAPAKVVVFTYGVFGVLLTIVPDQSAYLGMSNKGMFFTAFTLASIASRLFAGKAADKYGPVLVLKVASVFLTISMIVLAMAKTPFLLMAGVSLTGFAMGINSPAVFAWAISRCEPHNRGRSMATVYIALEIGIGGGAFLSAWLYDNDPSRFGLTFIIFAVMVLLPWPLLVKEGRRS